MRTLQKNNRPIKYQKFIGSVPIIDEWGNDTLEVRNTYGELVDLDINVGASVGSEEIAVFGAYTDYSRVLCSTNNVLAEKDKVYFNSVEYVVNKIADSKNGVLIAIKELQK